ncbi:hypothetical protein [Chromobacterium violaceum]|uniref:hypothetical protein n=1 Tax=Chromobacterium violaceum TaxID=536 RepID=UPI001E3BA172|nr:hypothetical protein [Chromobacterium violaceum]
MELRLLIPMGAERAGWSIELVLPPCHECRATVSLDVGGRIQTLDMRGMQGRRRVTVELSVAPYRIVSFSGKPDPSFVAGVERECPGLPTMGAAAFAALGRGELKGFPRTWELRGSETFALLWREPAEPGFPDELAVDRLSGRQGWNLALITIPDEPSPECTDWLRSFTRLPFAPPVPSIIPIWPFLTRNSSINEVECVRSGMVLLSAKMMPVGLRDQGPTMQVQSASAKLSVVGVERSPSFFALKPDGVGFVKVAEANTSDIEAFVSFSLHSKLPQKHPEVELAFTTPEGGRCIVPLHQRRCVELATEARMHRMGLEYLSMPRGAMGMLRVDGPTGRSVTALSSGCDAPPHCQHMRLPPPDVLVKLTSVLVDPTNHVEIEFGGFGRLRLAGSWISAAMGDGRKKLAPALRSRLLSFMLQLRLAVPTVVHEDDVALVGALIAARPELPLIPHYRSLVKEVLACGFELKYLGEGTPL